MPFFYDQTNIEWPEDDSEPPPPRADQFFYMTAAEYCGQPAEPRATVRFSTEPFDDTEMDQLPEAPAPFKQRGFFSRLLGKDDAAERQQQHRKHMEYDMRRSMLLQRKRMQALFSTTVPALRSLGVRRAYCRYDGGNDEGFSWLDHLQTETGERVDTGDLLKRLYELGLHDKLAAAGFKDHVRGDSIEEKISDLETFVCARLPNDWSWVLMGNFGTGEYSMYGAFTVDLEECSITDDPKAEPVVKHVTVAN